MKTMTICLALLLTGCATWTEAEKLAFAKSMEGFADVPVAPERRRGEECRIWEYAPGSFRMTCRRER